MFATTDKPDQAASGLAALVLLLRFHGIGANSEQIGHRFDGNIGVQEMLLCAKEFGLKARAYRSNWQRLSKTPLPGIAVLRDGSFLILGKASGDQILVQNPLLSRPILMSALRIRGGLGWPDCADDGSRWDSWSFRVALTSAGFSAPAQIPLSAW